jgi:hypothetical protein
LPSDTCENSARPLAAQIHKAFVENPHQLLDWGRVIPPGDPCRPIYDAIIQTGPWGSRSEPRDAMKATGCKAEATFNKDPSGDRLWAAVLVLVATIFVMILLVLIAATLIASQIGVVVALALSPFALVAGSLPAGGRQLLWRWLGGVGRALAGVVMTGVFLSLFLVSVGAVLNATSGEFLIVQMGVIDLLVVMALIARKRLLKAGRRGVNRAVQRLEQSRAGGSGRSGWLSPAAAGAVAGFGAGEAFELRQAHQQVRGAVHTHRRRQAEKAMIETRRAQAANTRAGTAGRTATAGSTASAAAGVAAAAATGGTAKTSAMRSQLQARMGQSSTGRVVLGASKVAVTGAKVAFASTVGAPVYAPRAAMAATNKAVQLKGRLAGATERRVDQAGSFAREYGRNVAAPARWARNFVTADETAAARAAASAGGVAAAASRRRRPEEPPSGAAQPRPRGWQSWDRKRDWEGRRPTAEQASGGPRATPSTPGPRRNPTRTRPEGGRTGTATVDAPRGSKRADLERRLAGARDGAGPKDRGPRSPRQPR